MYFIQQRYLRNDIRSRIDGAGVEPAYRFAEKQEVWLLSFVSRCFQSE